MVRVKRLELRDFRNYERAEVALAPGLTVICGPNGAGKTNLLEALYFGCTGRSCRTSNERELVRFGQKVTRVSVGVEAEDGGHSLDVGFEPGEQKRFRIDGAQVDRPAPGEIRPLVGVFMPDRLDLVKGAPALRRAHIDQVIAALWPARGTARTEYSRALAQRNALVARIRAGTARRELLDPWDSELARHGIAVMEARRAALSELEGPFARLAAELGLPGRCALEYRPRSKAHDADGLRAELVDRREDDLARGFTGHAAVRSSTGRAPRRTTPTAFAPNWSTGVRTISRAASPGTAPTATTLPSRAIAELCAPTAPRASSASDCWRCCSPSARSWPPPAGRR